MNQVEKVIAVQRMQEYIEEHIGDVITLKELSEAAGYSPWHSDRVFRDIIGKTPFEYIRLLRLTHAAKVLRDGKPKVIDVALDYVFDSHEGFTRAFSKEFGLSPKKYSKYSPPIPYFMPGKVYDVYRQLYIGGNMMTEKNTKTIFVQVVERPARKVMLKRGVEATEYYAYCNEVGCDVWGVLCSVKEALYEPIGMWLPKSYIKEGTSEYVQGVELPLDFSNSVPEGYELIEVPACKMMIFQGEPYNDDDIGSAIGDVWDHIQKFDPSIYGYQWAPEKAPRFQLAPMGYRGYIEGRPVMEIK
ncbi:MAG TPA: AraC family transcriptional regulator [Lachnospiraceae bacterium]|nr:AraC family transcriptional regulator [Lachnospiraceae bacterium]